MCIAGSKTLRGSLIRMQHRAAYASRFLLWSLQVLTEMSVSFGRSQSRGGVARDRPFQVEVSWVAAVG